MARIIVNLDATFIGQYEIPSWRVTTIGRSSKCAVRFDNPAISGLHAIFYQEKGMFYIEDKNSTNGVLVNGNRISKHALKDGDIIEIVRYRITFWSQYTSAIDADKESPVIMNDAEKAIHQKEEAKRKEEEAKNKTVALDMIEYKLIREKREAPKTTP